MLVLVAVEDVYAKEYLSQALELGFPGSKLTQTFSGKECILTAKSSHPDIIILDCYLEDMDSFSVLKEIRAFSDVPIIMLSYLKDELQLAKALEAGADEYMTKPIHSMELLARIKSLIKRSRKDVKGRD
jgi:DNA-binding response OmpR family regulator